MGLRTSFRKRFGSSSESSDKPATTSKSSKSKLVPADVPFHLHPSKQPHYTDRKDITYYKPHEIPRSKYRGRVDPIHSANLAAFSLESAFTAERRISLAPSGTFSPGGTKSRSLAPSAVQSRANSRAASRRPSWTSKGGSDESDESSREKSSAASTVLSGSSDSTGNTSLSPSSTQESDNQDSDSKHAPLPDSGSLDLSLAKTATLHDTPFTVAELEHAMTRATLPPRSLDHERDED